MKKVFSLLLSAVMLLGLIPAFAEEAPAAETATAYIMYANADWSTHFWMDGKEYAGVKATSVDVGGEGDYSVALDFDAPSEGLAFAALGIKNGEKVLPGYTVELKAIRLNGEEIEFKKGYTSSDDGIETRMNIYNEWVAELPKDARSFDGSTDGAAPIIVEKEKFTNVSRIEIDFALHAVKDTAYLMYANGDWSSQYWFDGKEYAGVTAQTAEVTGEGTYTVGLTFDSPAEGLAFAGVGVATGEKTFNGYFINVTEVKVNGEAIELGKGFTTTDDGITTRENLYNEWVNGVPAEARRQDGDLEGASAIIVDKEKFTGVNSIEATFEYIYGEPIVKEADAPMTADDAKALKEKGFNAYIGVQGKDTYVFRNAWNDTYGRDDEANPGFFTRLTGWDADNQAVDYGGTFVDAAINGDGEYTVSLTTGDMGFGSTEAFNLVFVSTDIPGKLVADGLLTIDNIKVKGLSNATQELGADVVDASGDYVLIRIIDTYNLSADPFGYTVPGANAEISISFTVSGW